MANRVLRVSLTIVCCLVLSSSCAFGQDDKQRERQRESQKPSAAKTGAASFVEDVEPGVRVLGAASRFAEVGNSSSFDSSPDGRHLAFASGKIKFFNLSENKVTDTIGQSNEHYQHVRYSPDGRYVFAAGQRKGKPIVRVYDVIDKESVGTITTETNDIKDHNHFHLQGIQVSADATYVALTSNQELQIREVSSGDLIYRAKDLGYLQSACFTADEKYFIFPKSYRLVAVNIKSGEEQKASDFPMVGQRCYSVSCNIASNKAAIPVGNSLAIYSLDNPSVEPVTIKMPSGSHVQNSGVFSDDGELIATSAYGGQFKIMIVDVGKKEVVREIPIASSGQLDFRFTSDNKSLLVSGQGISGVKEISIEKNSVIPESKHPSGTARKLAIHPDGEAFLTATQGGEVSWFDMKTGEVYQNMTASNLKSFDLNESGSDVLFATMWNPQKGISVYSFDSGKEKKNYSFGKSNNNSRSVFSQIRRFMRSENGHVRHHQYPIDSRFADDHTKIHSATYTQEHVWEMESEGMFGSSHTTNQEQNFYLAASHFDVSTGKRKSSPRISLEKLGYTKHEWPQTVAVSPRGDQFAVARSKTLFLIDAETSQTISEIDMSQDDGRGNLHFSEIQYSPDGQFVALLSHQALSVIDVDSGEELFSSKARFFAFSSDGKRLAAGSSGKNAPIEIFSTETWKPVFTREKTVGNRTAIALSNDGQVVLIGLADCRIEAWDLNKITK